MRFGYLFLAGLAQGTAVDNEGLRSCLKQKEKDFVKCQVVGSCGRFVTLQGIRECKRNDEQLEMLKNLAVVLEREFEQFQKPFLVKMKLYRACLRQVLEEQVAAGDRHLPSGLAEIKRIMMIRLRTEDAPDGELGRKFWKSFLKHLDDDEEDDDEEEERHWPYMTSEERIGEIVKTFGVSIDEAGIAENVLMEQAKRDLFVLKPVYSEHIKTIAENGLGKCVEKLESDMFGAIMFDDDIPSTIRPRTPRCRALIPEGSNDLVIEFEQHVRALIEVGKTQLVPIKTMYHIVRHRTTYMLFPLFARFRDNEAKIQKLVDFQRDVMNNYLLQVSSSPTVHPLVVTFIHLLKLYLERLPQEPFDVNDLLYRYDYAEDKDAFLEAKRQKRIGMIAQLLFNGDENQAEDFEIAAMNDFESKIPEEITR